MMDANSSIISSSQEETMSWQAKQNRGRKISLMMKDEVGMFHLNEKNEKQQTREFPNCLWREKVTQWYYDVVDHLGESRDIVYSSMYMLDRLCCVDSFKQYSRSEKDYELAAMTAFFLSLRLRGSNRIGPEDIMRMSRRGIEVQDIIKMAKLMMKALAAKHGKHRLLTPMNFVHAFLSLLPKSMDDASKRGLLESATYLVEVSVYDSFFSGVEPSKIAYAAILNAMDGVGSNRGSATSVSDTEKMNLRQEIFDITGLHYDEIQSIKSRLSLMYSRSAEDQVSRQQGRHIIPEPEADRTRGCITPSEGTFNLSRMVSFENLQNKNNKRAIHDASCPRIIHDEEEVPKHTAKRIRRLPS